MKYIDAEKLIVEIERHIKHYEKLDRDDFKNGELYICQELLSFVKSLRQEQPESLKGEFVFPNFLYARTVDNKTIDVSYAPQSLDAVEYIKNDPTEQTEVALEEEMDRYFDTMQVFEHENIFEETFHKIARHFYELGLNAKEENK